MSSILYKTYRHIRSGRVAPIHAFLKMFAKSINRPNLAGALYTNMRLIFRPDKYWRRKSWSSYFSKQSSPSIMIDPSLGFSLVTKNELPDLPRIVKLCNKILDEKGRDKLETWHKDRSSEHSKGYFYNVLSEEDILNHPELMDFALSEDVIASVHNYIGMMPRLCSIGIYYSDVSEDIRGSQDWHLDGTDPHHVKCFINLTQVQQNNGPFTFIPAKQTEELRIASGGIMVAAGNENSSLLNEYYSLYGQQLVGEPGSAAFVDAARCLHYGSRCEQGHRIVFMFHYSVFADYAKAPLNPLRDIRIMHHPSIQQAFATSNLRKEVLSIN